jgi:hypothetical protein
MDIDSFKGNFANAARPNLFKVTIESNSDYNFYCKGASIPASTIASVDVPYMGRVIKVQGNRTYEDWTVTIYNDEGFTVRKMLEEMHTKMNGAKSNTSTEVVGVTANVVQLGLDGTPSRTYTFSGMFPTEIGSIELAWDSNDTVEEYTVTFAYNFWEAAA